MFFTGFLSLKVIALNLLLVPSSTIGKPKTTTTTILQVKKPFDGEILAVLLLAITSIFGYVTILTRDLIATFEIGPFSSRQTIGAATEF